jgi:hypothetical protein
MYETAVTHRPSLMNPGLADKMSVLQEDKWNLCNDVSGGAFAKNMSTRLFWCTSATLGKSPFLRQMVLSLLIGPCC